jgi:hypothetical protein
MVNYGNGKIYKIERLSDNALIYVGSTTKEYLSSRLEHKNKAKQCPNRKVYKLISNNEGWENHQILLIKNYSCGSKNELKSEEARFIRCLKPIGNKNIPMRTDKEYKIDNKARNLKICICCCGKNYTHTNKSRHFKTKHHMNSIPVQFKIIEEMHIKIIEEIHKNRKQYIFQQLPEHIFQQLPELKI